MAPDIEQRLRRSLSARSRDVEADPATWEAVRTRIRRRAVVRWSLACASAAAVVVLAVLTLPGVLTETRIELTPADPRPGALSAIGLVSTDGRTVVVTGTDGEVVREVEPPTDADDPLPVHRLAVRPGSTRDDLDVVYVRADDLCDRVEMGWMAVDGEAVSGGSLAGGQGFCMTDPVWSPDGDAVAWVERTSPTGARPSFELQVRSWKPDGPGESPTGGSGHAVDVAGAESVRAVDWWAESGDAGSVSLAVVDAGGNARAERVRVEHAADGAFRVTPAPADVGPPEEDHAGGDTATDGVSRGPTLRPAQLVASGDGRSWYGLGTVSPAGDVVLFRLTDGSPQERLPLPADVLSPQEIDSGDAWLSAGGGTVVVGAGGDGSVVEWDGQSWGDLHMLPGVVHAVVVAGPDAEPQPTPEPSPDPEPMPGPPAVATDGRALVADLPEGAVELVGAAGGEITGLAVHPDSTVDDLTVVWREGRGCDAEMRYARHADGETTTGSVPASCPGHPVFAPRGEHLAWVSSDDAGMEQDATFTLEVLTWRDGPAGEPTPLGFEADRAETFTFDAVDWVWNAPGRATEGLLHLVGYDGHGTPVAHVLPIERGGDAAVGLPAGATAEDQPAIVQADSHLRPGEPASPSYSLEPVPLEDRNSLQIVRHDGGSDAFPLPDGLLRVYGGAAETDNVWMTARGDDVLLGDGAGRAWWLRWTGEAWGELVPLTPDTRYAVALPQAPEGPEDVGASDGGLVQPDVVTDG